MKSVSVEDFLHRFQAAWRTLDPAAFEALWHVDGVLHYPPLATPLRGADIGKLVQATRAVQPDIEWKLLRWADRGDWLFLQWQTNMSVPRGERMVLTGVDQIRLSGGKIAEEIVYMDTQPIHAALDPHAQRGPLLQLSST